MDNKKIGSFLQGLRKEKNMTQLELANQLSFTHQTISKWEKGDSLPDIQTLQILAQFYQISIEELLEGERKIIETVDHTFEKEKIFEISRLSITFLIFLSLFMNYLSEKVNLGDTYESMFPQLGGYDPFNISDTVVTVSHRGINLVFQATKLSLFTLGGWLIFLSSFLLIGMSIYIVYLIFNQKVFTDLTKSLRFISFIVLEGLMFLGFILILIGVIGNHDVSANIGYILGFIFTLMLLGVHLLELKLKR